MFMMVNFLPPWLSFSLILSLFVQQGLSLVLEDAEAPNVGKTLLERGVEPSEDAVFSAFNRLSKDSYYWSGTVYTRYNLLVKPWNDY